jgi:hypothetical protein
MKLVLRLIGEAVGVASILSGFSAGMDLGSQFTWSTPF